MRPLPLLLALAACKSGNPQTGTGAQDITFHSALATDEEDPPPYSIAELEAMLGNEHKRLEASIEVGTDDVAVRKRFISTLELCKATRRYCPPRIDDPAWNYDVEADVDPKLDTPLRFDVETWRKVSTELHGRACACRTIECVDSLEVAIARLETRPMPDVQSDDDAALAIVRARDCLSWLRGKRSLPRVVTE